MTGIPPLVSCLIDTARASCAALRQEITGPTYGTAGTLEFTFRGIIHTVPEPRVEMPVGAGEAGRAWCLRKLLDGEATPKA